MKHESVRQRKSRENLVSLVVRREIPGGLEKKDTVESK